MTADRIGANVKAAREQAGRSQEDLAHAIGVSVFTISRLERGKVKNPSLRQLTAIAEALGVDPRTLLAQGKEEK